MANFDEGIYSPVGSQSLIWHVKATYSTPVENIFRVTITSTMKRRSAGSFPLDLMDLDIWLTQTADHDFNELFRFRRSLGQLQNILGDANLNAYCDVSGEYITGSITQDYTKEKAARDFVLNYTISSSASVYTNLLGMPTINIGFTIPAGYTPPSEVNGSVIGSTHEEFNVSVSWKNGTKTATAYATDIPNAGRDVSLGQSSPAVGYTKKGATPNKLYDGIHLWVNDTGVATDNVFAPGSPFSYWTKPYIKNPTVSLVSGNEHNQIKVTANTDYTSGSDQYAFKIDNGAWSGWQTGRDYIFTGIAGNTSHTLYTKMKNTKSGYESVNTTSASITTWYDPIYSLSVNMVNNWFWYLSVKCTFNYQGGSGNIKKYEFDIGSQGWQNKGTTNSHARGSTSPTGSGKLNYNSNYVCKVRITDNHGRTREASATFKTLDERPLYVNGQLREVKVIKSNGSIGYITPNLLSVINSSGGVTNMNKIINNDNRTQF